MRQEVSNCALQRGFARSAAFQGFQFIQRARPIGSQQTRKTAFSKHLAACLAARAVVRFIVGVANALHLLPATRTGLIEATMTAISGRKAVTFSGNFFAASAP